MDRENKKSIAVPVLRIHQPIGDFYIGAISAKDLRDICWFDIRRLHQKEGIDDFLGIQRELSPKRVAEIKRYVEHLDATFPTGVIVSVDEVCATIEYHSELGGEQNRFGVMQLSNYPDPENEGERILYKQIARIIDGQHRIAGLEDYEGDDFEINVVIFVGADLSDQATIFSTVNLAQTKVNRSLVYDLFSLATVRSPQKTCHEIAVALDRTEASPFYRRIKRLGVSTEGRFGETLSQATFVKALLKYISSDPSWDQDQLKRSKKLPPITSKERRTLIFRNLFIDDEDPQIANIIWDYFDAVRVRWPNAWNSTGKGAMLNRTNGFEALMRFLRPAYTNFTTSGSHVSSADFLSVFERVPFDDLHFTTERYKPGTSGSTDLYRDLLRETGLDE